MIGQSIATMISTLNIDPNTIQCIGHSLGGHVCGFFGKQYQIIQTGKKIARITGLFLTHSLKSLKNLL